MDVQRLRFKGVFAGSLKTLWYVNGTVRLFQGILLSRIFSNRSKLRSQYYANTVRMLEPLKLKQQKVMQYSLSSSRGGGGDFVAYFHIVRPGSQVVVYSREFDGHVTQHCHFFSIISSLTKPINLITPFNKVVNPYNERSLEQCRAITTKVNPETKKSTKFFDSSSAKLLNSLFFPAVGNLPICFQNANRPG